MQVCRDPEHQGKWSTLSSSLHTNTLTLPFWKLKKTYVTEDKEVSSFLPPVNVANEVTCCYIIFSSEATVLAMLM